MFTATLFTRTEIWKQSKLPFSVEWIKKMWHIFTIKKEGNLVICGNINEHSRIYFG